MSDVEKIQAASAELAEMQEALATLQTGLEKAEDVALAAEKAKQRSEQLLVVALGTLGLAALLALISKARRKS